MSKKKKPYKRKKPTSKKVRATKTGKRKSTAKYKGVQYIAQKLKKYFGKKYPSIKSALPKAHEILKTLSEQGRSVTVKNIFDLVRKHRVPKPPDKAPFIPPEMFDQSVYWEVLESDYPLWISQTSKDIEFRSKISPKEVSVFNGGDKVTYQTHFVDFVIYCNKMLSLMREQELIPKSEDGALISTTIPKKDKSGKWFVEIYTCDIHGEEQDYGFDQNNVKASPLDFKTPGEEFPGEPIKKPEPPEGPKKIGEPEPTKKPEPTKDIELEKLRLESQERIKKAEIESSERIKQLKIADLKALLKDKIITFDEYLRGIKEI